MALVFETVHTEGIAALSYLIGDDSTGVAAVVDPTVDVEKYLTLAKKKAVSITHIFETHIHADLVSGSRKLQAASPGAKIYVSHEGSARYGFDNEALKDGDEFTIGKTIITVRFTPGHTPEHVSYELKELQKKLPWGVLTGDSLFVNSAGRPDLLGEGEAKKLAHQQYHTLYNYYLKLDDSVIIYPAHGHGSPCGADIGERLTSTIGYERIYNTFLQFKNVDSFTEYSLSTAPAEPTYYPRMKKVNAKGPELGEESSIKALPPKSFNEALKNNEGILVDTRSMLSFGAGHIEGALNIGASPMLSIWAGWLLDPQKPILLVIENDKDLEKVKTLFARTGYSKFAGYLVGGMKAWNNAGEYFSRTKQISVHELQDVLGTIQVVDVRADSEWQKGHIPTAKHIFLPELRERCEDLDKSKPIAVYCDSGYRASIASSILTLEGFATVVNVPGSWQAWEKAELPVEGIIER